MWDGVWVYKKQRFEEVALFCKVDILDRFFRWFFATQHFLDFMIKLGGELHAFSACNYVKILYLLG